MHILIHMLAAMYEVDVTDQTVAIKLDDRVNVVECIDSEKVR